jgi:hypothetical protein
MKYWYDTEFCEDGSTIEPISIGIVADDGREYYAVFRDTNWESVAGREWLVRNVVPFLPQLTLDHVCPTEPLDRDRQAAHHLGINLDDPAVKPRQQIADEVRDFLLVGGMVELWGYYSSYDHILLSQLWGQMIDRPTGIPMWTNDIQQVAASRGLDNSLPKQVGNAHNALDDARWTRDAWAYLHHLS